MSLQAWSALASGGVAVATLLLAFFTYRLVRATTQSLKMIERHAEEAAKARIDAVAPRVTALPAKPDWPPSYEDPALERDSEIPRDAVFVLPNRGQERLWLRTLVLLRNEGASTGLVQIGGRGRFIEGTGPFGGSNRPIPVEVFQGRHVLRPGQEALLLFEDSRPLSEWAKAYERRSEAPSESKLTLEIVVTDHFDDGIVDNIIIETQTFPIEPVEHDPGRWRLSRAMPHEPSDFTDASVRPVRRRYFVSKRENNEL